MLANLGLPLGFGENFYQEHGHLGEKQTPATGYFGICVPEAAQ